MLLRNHVHLVLRTPRPNLSAGMQYFPRAAAAWLARRLTTATPLGLSHFGSVPNLTRQADRERAHSPSFRLQLEQLEARLAAAASPPTTEGRPSKEKTRNKT